MMTRAYDELYLKDAMRNMGIMAHFCINEYGLAPSAFEAAFQKSHVSKQIAKGNPNYLVGHSGKELADMVISEHGIERPVNEYYSVTPEYWAGWVLAYYQWYTAKDFAQISAEGLSFDKILRMYYPLHEADLSKFVELAMHSTQINGN